jgi:hypothetical protein
MSVSKTWDYTVLQNLHNMKCSSEPPTLRIKKILEKLTGYQFESGKEIKVCDFLSQSHDSNDKSGCRIRLITMMDLAKGWAQGIRTRMKEENKLSDEIDLPAPLPSMAHNFSMEEGLYIDEYQTYLALSDSNRRITRSMMKANVISSPSSSTRSSTPSGPRTRSQTKLTRASSKPQASGPSLKLD